MAVESIYLPEMATICRVETMTEWEKLFEVELKSGRPLGHDPGQFVEVSVFGIGEAPISVSSAPDGKNSFEMVVRNVGNVTGALHRLEAGATIGLRGPFGTGFPLDELEGRNLIMVAGGLGLVPLRSLIQTVLNNRSDYENVTIFYGCKQPAELLFRDELAQWQDRDDVDLQVTIDRPHPDWDGKVGVVTTLFEGIDLDPRTTTVVLCGPPIMYRFVILECMNRGVAEEDIIVDFERRMKCGVAKCGHCQINNKYVCQDGPVFRYHEIAALREAI
jgi:sulfhydrogenase subunit gamma (sulfur reductase)